MFQGLGQLSILLQNKMPATQFLRACKVARVLNTILERKSQRLAFSVHFWSAEAVE